MRIYIAASFPRKDEACRLRDILKTAGHKVVSRWLDQEYSVYDTGGGAKEAYDDFSDIISSEMLIQITGDTLTHGGRHTELGIALALKKLCVIMGPREQVFHSLPIIAVCKTPEEVVKIL
jgi:hypothetical protein